MIKILLLSLLLIHQNVFGQLFLGETSENKVPGEICKQTVEALKRLRDKSSCELVAADFKDYLGESFSVGNKTYLDICDEMLDASQLGGMSEAQKVCDARSNEIDTSFSFANFYRSANITDADTKEETYSSDALYRCEDPELNNCTLGITNAHAWEDFQKILDFSPMSKTKGNSVYYDENHCHCLEKNLEARDDGSSQMDLAKQKKNLNDFILKGASKKLVDSYAGNLEDIEFFLHNKGNLLGATKDNVEYFECSNAEDFQTEIKKTCGNSLSQDEISKRFSSILNSLGGNYTGKSIQDQLHAIKYDILNINLDSSKLGKNPKGQHQDVLNREDFDRMRFAAYKDLPDVKFMDSLSYEILHDQKLSILLTHELEGGKNPGYAIMSVLDVKINPEVKSFLTRFLQKHQKEPLYQSMLLSLKNNSDDYLKKKLKDVYQVAVNSHPGVKAMFANTELFSKIRTQEYAMSGKKRENFSLLASMDAHPDFLKNYFQEKCGSIKKGFAQAVCTNPDDLISKTNADDLNKALLAEGVKFDPMLKDALICRQPKKPGMMAQTIFSHVYFGPGDVIRRSDYYDRKTSKALPGEATDGFTAMANAKMNGRSGLFTEIENKCQEYDDQRVNMSFDMNQNVGASSRPNSVSELTPSGTSTEAGLEKNLASQRAALAKSPAAPASPVYMPPTMMETLDKAQATNELSDSDLREQVRHYLSNDQNSQEVNKHLSNTKPEDLKEIMRLRQEISSDQNKMLDLAKETEANKIRALEDQYHELESKYKVAQKNAVDSKSTQGEVTPFSQSAVNNYRPQNITAGASGGTTGASQFRAPGSVSGSSFSASSGTAGNTSGAGTNSSSSVVTYSSKTNSDTGSVTGAIIISSAELRTKAPMNPSQELVNYVLKNSPDVATLKKLKESGMVYKYKVVEDGVPVEKEILIDYSSLSPEAKEFLDSKIASKEPQTQQDLQKLQKDYLAAKRAYSVSALKQILGIQVKKTQVNN